MRSHAKWHLACPATLTPILAAPIPPAVGFTIPDAGPMQDKSVCRVPGSTDLQPCAPLGAPVPTPKPTPAQAPGKPKSPVPAPTDASARAAPDGGQDAAGSAGSQPAKEKPAHSAPSAGAIAAVVLLSLVGALLLGWVLAMVLGRRAAGTARYSRVRHD